MVTLDSDTLEASRQVAQVSWEHPVNEGLPQLDYIL